MNAYKPLIISYYQQGIYNKDDLALFVSVGWISQAEVDELESRQENLAAIFMEGSIKMWISRVG